MPKNTRKLAAIMFTDIVGFTEKMGENEAAALNLLQMNRELLKPIIKSFRGKWLKEMGDGTFSSFNSAVDAVKCALEIQRILDNNDDLTIRIGIHIGDVVQQGEDIFGDGVNIAARLEPMASPGGICISEKVHDDIRNKPNIHTKLIGEKNLKGVDRPLKIYSILTDSFLESKNIIRLQKNQSSAPKIIFSVLVIIGILLVLYFIIYTNLNINNQINDKSVAVLPFDNYSTASEDQFFSDGVTEVIIANLAKIKDLKVISRTSVMQYKNTEKTIREIGKELGVAHILEGSIQRAGDKVRIVGQLINAESDEHVWAETYDGNISNFFEFQTDIALKIANALKITITSQADELIHKIPTKNMQAWENYLKGLDYFRKSNLAEDMVSARHYFDSAFFMDSLFVESLAMSASSDLLVYWMGLASRDKMVNSAKEKIEKAKSINPRSSQVLNAEGTYYYYGFRDYLTALNFYEQASEIEPGNGDIIANIGYVRRRMGDLEASVKIHEEALVLNPNNPDLLFQIVETYRHLRQYSKTIEMSKKKVTLYPNELGGHIDYVKNYGLLTLDLEKMQEKLVEVKQKFLIENHENYDRFINYNILARNYDEALAVLKNVNESIIKGQLAFLPISYIKAEIFEFQGNNELAEEFYLKSLKELMLHYHDHPNDERILSRLALNYAVLGDSVNAVNLINAARNLIPIEKDPLIAPNILNKEAEVYLRLNNFEKCLEILEYSSSIPAGIHALDLLHPIFDKIREHPRFIKLFKSLPPNNKNEV